MMGLQTSTTGNNGRHGPLEQPLIECAQGSAPRLLDRDGAFSQSRGRWRVSNSDSRSRTHPPGLARQRRAIAASVGTLIGGEGGASPFEVLPPLSERSPNSTSLSFINRLCCGCYKSDNEQGTIPRRCWDDWFHTLSYTPTCILMLGIFIAYFVTIILFAGMYLTINKVGGGYVNNEGATISNANYCGMDINNHMEALYFSLSTMATIGYGTSDYYFGDCWTPFILVLLQVFSAIVFSSLAVGLLFQRMSRGQKRGRTIVFTDLSVIRKVGGRWYWMFRVAELRKHHIIGAKIRCFCVIHERCPVSRSNNGGVDLETAYFVSHPLPLLNGSRGTKIRYECQEEPNSECSLEQNIVMGLPHVVVHRMDSRSPLLPPRPVWYDEEGVPHGPRDMITTSLTAGDSALEDSVLQSLLTEEGQLTLDNVPDDGGTAILPTEDEITHFLQDRQAEIIVFLEGTCEVTGMALQARHSYRIEDIAFHKTFAPCIFPAGLDEAASQIRWWNPFTKHMQEPSGSSQRNVTHEIDFSQYHGLVPAPVDSMACPFIPSSSMSSSAIHCHQHTE